jgi:hypothetical protein
MAQETTTTAANDTFLAAQLDSMVAEEVRPQNVSRGFFRYAKLTISKSHDWPIQDDPGPATASLGEGTGFVNTQLTTTKSTATASTVGMMATITDELSAISIVDAYSHFGDVLVRSVWEKYETDFTALMDDFSNTTSTTGVDLTISKFLEAAAALVARDIPGNRVAVLHPVQTADMQQDGITSTAAIYGRDASPTAGQYMPRPQGFQFNVGDIPVYQTSLIPTANGGADRAGAIFAANQALGLAETWDTRTETERDASMPGTEIVVTANYGVVEIRDSFGQTVVSDA